jgi:hypothetical protein
MATFGQLLARQRGKQALQSTLGRTKLQSDVQEEQKQLDAARREYQNEVEKAEREMKKRAKKRSRRRLIGQVVGTGVGLVTGNPLLGAGVTGGVSGLGAGLVPEYEKTIEDLAPGGKFFSEARKDFDADIASTNQFIKDAAEGQNLLDLTNALTDSYTSYNITKSFGKDFDKMFKKRVDVVKGKDTFFEKLGGKLFNEGKPMEFFEKGTFGDYLMSGQGGVSDRIKARLEKQTQGASMFKNLLEGKPMDALDEIEIPSLDDSFTSYLQGLMKQGTTI